MRHHNTNRKFGRKKNERKALISSLVSNLIIKGKIKTTLAKAKEIRPVVEKMVTRAKKGDLATRRIEIARLGGRTREIKKLFDVLAPAYKDKQGGYTRIMKLGGRLSDSAQMAIIEFV